jgi:hypothetical protein
MVIPPQMHQILSGKLSLASAWMGFCLVALGVVAFGFSFVHATPTPDHGHNNSALGHLGKGGTLAIFKCSVSTNRKI